MSTPVSNAWWSRAAAALVVSALSLSLVAGCAEDSKDAEVAAPEPAPAEVEEASEVELLTYEDIVISEKGPTVAELGSAEGAKEAVQLFITFLYEGMKSKEVVGVETISDSDCNQCKFYVALIQNMSALDYEMPTDARWQIGDMLAYQIEEPVGSYVVLARVDTYDWLAIKDAYEGKGAIPETIIGEPMAFVVRPLESQWVVSEFVGYEEDEFQELWNDMQGFEQ